jgi:hypothetical protein
MCFVKYTGQHTIWFISTTLWPSWESSLWPAALLCGRCPLGTAGASSGLRVCELCPLNSFASMEGSTSCQACASISQDLITVTAGASNITQCLCRPGTFASMSSAGASESRESICQACDPMYLQCGTSSASAGTNCFRVSKARVFFSTYGWKCLGTTRLVLLVRH